MEPRPQQSQPGLPRRPAAPLPNLVLPFAPVPELDVAGYERLTRDVRALLGIDLAHYKPAQVWRRVNGFASARGLKDADGLVAKARTDAVLRQAFLDMLTINVSEFFRNAEAFSAFASSFLGPLAHKGAPVRIWSAGCSLGYEPYSLAMLLRELSPSVPIRILATDLDDTTLATARASRYNESQMLGVSPARRARWFKQDGQLWEVKPELRSLVTFRRHDLLKDSYESGFDAIVCRNVVIYFTDVAKTELYLKFGAALRPGGVLFLGATESIGDARKLGLQPAGNSFYVRPA